MAITVAQSGTRTWSSGATISGAAFLTTTTGNTLVVITAGYTASGQPTVSGITVSTGSATFTKLGAQTGIPGSYAPLEVWVAPNIVGGTTPVITTTFSSTLAAGDIFVYELAGMPSSTIQDGTAAGAAQPSATACITPNITTTNAGSIIFGAFSPINAIPSGVWPFLQGASTGGLTEYQIQTTVQTNLHAASTQSPAGIYSAFIFALQPAGAVTTLHFPMVIVDASSTTLTFHGVVTTLHFPMAIADASTVTIGFHGGTIPTGRPTLVQHVAFGMECNACTNFTFPFPNPTLSGNLLIIGFQFKNGGTITSVTDNVGNTYIAALAAPLNNTTYGQKMALYYCAGATAGVTAIKVALSGLSTIGGNASGMQAVISEWYNVATTSPIDGTALGNASSGAPGSIVTTVAGDLIYHWAIDIQSFLDGLSAGGAYNGTAITPGSGFTLLSADLQVGSADQYQIQSSAGSVSPALTPSGSKTWASIALAFKAAPGNGTAPPSVGIRIVNVQHTLLGNLGTSPSTPPIPLQFPSQGNLLVGLFNSPNTFITAASDSAGNIWSCPSSAQANEGSALACIIYAANAVTSPGLNNLTFTMSNTFQSMLVLYDVINAAPSPFDNATSSTGSQGTAGNLTTTGITPSTAFGLVFGHAAISFGTVAGTTTSGGIFDAAVNALNTDNPGAGGTGNSPQDEDNAYGHLYNSSTAAVSWVWNLTAGSPAASGWAADAAAFKRATPTFPLHSADSSSVTALGLEVGRHFPVLCTDTSAVLALGLKVGRHFPVLSSDTSAVLAIGLEVGRHFPVLCGDNSGVMLGFHGVAPPRFALDIADISVLQRLGISVQRHFPGPIVDTSTVQLTYKALLLRFPVAIADSSSVYLGFELSAPAAPSVSLIVAPYTGQSQQTLISIPAHIAYRSQREEGCWVLPPYASIYPPTAQAPEQALVPPPVRTSDLWNAMQTWPL